jgi:hypothetical protein
VIPALFISLAARIKNGIARSGKLFNPAEIRSGRIKYGVPLSQRKANEESNIANPTGQFTNSRITNPIKKIASGMIKGSFPLEMYAEAPASAMVEAGASAYI